MSKYTVGHENIATIDAGIWLIYHQGVADQQYLTLLIFTETLEDKRPAKLNYKLLNSGPTGEERYVPQASAAVVSSVNLCFLVVCLGVLVGLLQ